MSMVSPGLFRAATVAFGVFAVLPAQALTQDEWDEALRSVMTLDASAFPELPAAVAQSMEARGCSVPQTYVPVARQNVISGQFVGDQSRQWAVLCTAADTSAILVFGESGEELSAFQRSPDRQWLQGVGGGRIGYSRLLRTVGRDEIIRRTSASDARLPPIERDGIEEIFTEKGSTIWYWDEQGWVSLPGLD